MTPISLLPRNGVDAASAVSPALNQLCDVIAGTPSHSAAMSSQPTTTSPRIAGTALHAHTP